MNEVICAVATPPGAGGIGIVRLSGDRIEPIAQALIGGLPPPRRARLVRVRDASQAILDEGLALHFPAPASFTGEHVLELQLHGSPVVLAAVIEAAVVAGARRAEPGEFSQRAFLNDKLDLAQAEAIADLIAATSQHAARAARRSLEGALSQRVGSLAERITKLRVYVEAALDFPDEEIDFLTDGDVAGQLATLGRQTAVLLSEARAGRALTDGIRIAIVGKPNAGKSSLFNALARRDAAIVTEIPGTTRDVVRETVHLGGVPATLADTAGLRDTNDRVEREGVRRTHAELAQADLVFWVTDLTDLDPGPAPETDAPRIRIDNKLDLVEIAPEVQGDHVAVSALTGQGLDGLDRIVARHCGLGSFGGGEFSARARHVEQIQTTAQHIDQAMEVLQHEHAGELVAEELRQAADALGEITGKLHSDELLGRIFASFCIGK